MIKAYNPTDFARLKGVSRQAVYSGMVNKNKRNQSVILNGRTRFIEPTIIKGKETFEQVNPCTLLPSTEKEAQVNYKSEYYKLPKGHFLLGT